MELQHKYLKNNQGFVLITSLLILIILTILGVIVTRSTVIELQISGNEKVHKQTFYQADGGTELAQQAIYQNLVCSTVTGGFTKNYTFSGSDAALLKGAILVEDLKFANTRPSSDVYDTVSDSNRAFSYYPGGVIDNNQPHTNFYNTSKTVPNPGDPLGMIQGYDLLGNGSPSGTSRLYTFASQHRGVLESESKIQVRWRIHNFVPASASQFDCKF